MDRPGFLKGFPQVGTCAYRLNVKLFEDNSTNSRGILQSVPLNVEHSNITLHIECPNLETVMRCVFFEAESNH